MMKQNRSDLQMEFHEDFTSAMLGLLEPILSVVVGVQLGEINFRMKMFLEHSCKILAEPKKTKRRLKKVFLTSVADRGGNFWMLPFRAAVSGILIWFCGENMDKTRVLWSAFIWFAFRLFRLQDNCLEDIEILEEKGSTVGKAVAASVWFGFLENILKEQSIFQLYEEYGKDLQERILSKDNVSEQQMSFRKKIIILLPDSCSVDTLDYREERIFTYIPGLDRSDLLEKDERMKKDSEHQVAKGRMTMKVYWMFTNTMDEEEYTKAGMEAKSLNSKDKIFFMLDFPQSLKSVLGPKKGWESGARKREVIRFKKFIRSLIDGNIDYRKYRHDVLFLEFSSYVERPPLSSLIREKIRKSEEEANISSSGSDSDV